MAETRTKEIGPGVNNGGQDETQSLNSIELQNQIYGESKDEKYVIRGSILECNFGTNKMRIDLLKDHGVYTENEQPVLTCKDCKVGTNITTFGTCKHLQSTTDSTCVPNISGTWKQADGRLMIWEESGNSYEQALRDSATLVCQCRGGGLIKILEVPEQIATINQGATWVPQSGRWKYIDEHGEYLAGKWIKYKERWYYLGEDQYMVTGLQQVGVYRYYFEPGEHNGHMIIGWRKLDEKWYYFEETKNKEGEPLGHMVTARWQKYNEQWYYLSPEGPMATSQIIFGNNGEKYQVDENGVWDGKGAEEKKEEQKGGNYPQIAGQDNLGYLSGIGESNNNPALISTGKGDSGGKSYGAFQFASKFNIPINFVDWLQSRNDQYYNSLYKAYQLDGNTYGTNFDTAWRSIANNNKDEFFKLQYEYCKNSYYDSARALILSDTGFDFNTRSYALKNVLWSRSIHHGLPSAKKVFKNAISNAGLNLASATDEEIIRAFYKQSGSVVTTKPKSSSKIITATARYSKAHLTQLGIDQKYMEYFSTNDSDNQVGVWKRLNIDEVKEALDLLQKYGY